MMRFGLASIFILLVVFVATAQSATNLLIPDSPLD
jgi:hypothetical protein